MDEPEPTITINGTPLTAEQAMTVRVAIGSFFSSLQDLQDNWRDNADGGKALTAGYLARLREIIDLMERR